MNKISIRKIHRFSLAFIFIVGITIYQFINNAPVSTESNKITILHTNDMHGDLDSCYTPEGKLIQIGVDVTKSLKDSIPNSILIDAGDATQGGMLASSSQGSKVIELMNAAGYDIMALGNHEFDYGLDALKLNATLAQFDIISSNIYNNDNTPLLETEHSNGCNVIINKLGKKIGFFGLTTCATKYTTHPKNTEGVIFENEIESAKQQYQYLKDNGADIIVLISHIGTTDPNITTETIAQQVPGIDIIIDGHSHEVYSKTVGHTFIQQTGTKSKNIGKIEIEFQENNTFKINYDILKAEDLINPLDPDSQQLIPDSKVAALCKDMIQNVSESFHIIIGKTDSGLYGGEYQKTRICRLHDTNLGNLMGDALVHYGKIFLKETGITKNFPVVSLQNGGGIRTSILPKFISVGDIINVFPFPNKTSIKIISPNELYEILENGLKSLYIKDGMLSGPDGAFPNVGGMRIEFNINEEPLTFNSSKNKIVFPGSRVKNIAILNEDGSDNMILDRGDVQTQIALITNTFDASGGDQYIMLKGMPSLTDDGKLLSEVLTDYIKFITFEHGGTFNYPATLSRVQLIGSDDLFSKYSVKILVRENSVELKDKDITVSIDNNEPFKSHTDTDGNITISNLEEGPHDIKISRNNLYMNSYVNNRIGITNSDIFLENTSEQDIKNVINIIDGIPNQKVADMESYVMFTRDAYESLNDDEKSLVYNYKSLINAENAIIALDSSKLANKNSIYQTINKAYTIAATITLIVGSCVIIYIIKNKFKTMSSKLSINNMCD